MLDVRDPREDVTRHQARSDPIRVVKDGRVIDPEAERGGHGHGRSHTVVSRSTVRACFKGLTSGDRGVSLIGMGEVSGRWFFDQEGPSIRRPRGQRSGDEAG